MPKEKSKRVLSVEKLRHSEYYGLQETFDKLYAQSLNGEIFTSLMDLILSKENVLLAYRNIKANKGSNTAGTDKTTIEDLGRLTPEAMVDKVNRIITGNKQGYCPKPVRRKDIPKPNGSTRPLGIPCMWDRLIQQCIKQVMEPICEAKFSNNSYGFRPLRSVENAIAACYKHMQRSNLHFVIEFDIKSFFDEVDHSKLIKQIWAMGIRDKHLIFILKRILKAPIKLPEGQTLYPNKGTPQGGIISPLLANIVLNELDHWIDSQWQNNPVNQKYATRYINDIAYNGNGYRAMRKTNLKEMYIVRYADDFRIFCSNKTDAEKTLIAVTQWLEKRLRLQISAEKTRIVNVKQKYSEFLGFKIKVQKKSGKYVVVSHLSDKKKELEKEKLVEQAKNIARPTKGRTERDEIMFYNSMVMGIQNYYRIATNVSIDCAQINRAVMTVLTNRLKTEKGSRLVREYFKNKRKNKIADKQKAGRELTKIERMRYGKSAMLRFVKGSGEPIYPIGFVQHKNPMSKKRALCQYTVEGREGLHDNLRINTTFMLKLMRQPLKDRSAEYADNRISLYSAQWGKCAVTGKEFLVPEDIHCHHIKPRVAGGNDKYGNLVLVLESVHKLIHATKPETITFYMNLLNLTPLQMAKVNAYRVKAGYKEI